MRTSLRRLLLLFAAVGFTVLIGAGCQTTEGFGRDVEHVGKKIQGK